MSRSVLVDKSYAFSLRILKVSRALIHGQHEYDLGRQLLRAGTSVGANVEEADGAGSAKDFAARLRVSFREAKEARFWLRLLRDSGIMDAQTAEKLIVDAEELIRMINRSLTTVRRNHPT